MQVDQLDPGLEGHLAHMGMTRRELDGQTLGRKGDPTEGANPAQTTPTPCTPSSTETFEFPSKVEKTLGTSFPHPLPAATSPDCGLEIRGVTRLLELHECDSRGTIYPQKLQ